MLFAIHLALPGYPRLWETTARPAFLFPFLARFFLEGRDFYSEPFASRRNQSLMTDTG